MDGVEYETAILTEDVTSLQNLRKQVMETHARELDLYGRKADANNLRGEEGQAIHKGFERVLAAMHSVLAKLAKAESFTEIIERMRVLIDLNKKAREATRKKHEQALKEIFGDD